MLEGGRGRKRSFRETYKRREREEKRKRAEREREEKRREEWGERGVSRVCASGEAWNRCFFLVGHEYFERFGAVSVKRIVHPSMCMCGELGGCATRDLRVL